MNERKGFFQRAADRLRGKKSETRTKPEMVERGPEQHADDGLMHISDRDQLRGSWDGSL